MVDYPKATRAEFLIYRYMPAGARGRYSRAQRGCGINPAQGTETAKIEDLLGIRRTRAESVYSIPVGLGVDVVSRYSEPELQEFSYLDDDGIYFL